MSSASLHLAMISPRRTAGETYKSSGDGAGLVCVRVAALLSRGSAKLGLAPSRDRAIEAELRALAPGIDWSVKNQARMHLRNGDPPYSGATDAMRHWPETATAIARISTLTTKASAMPLKKPAAEELKSLWFPYQT